MVITLSKYSPSLYHIVLIIPRLYDLLNDLWKHSLVAVPKSLDDTGAIQIHRTVQVTVRDRCSEAKMREIFSLAARCIKQSMDSKHQTLDFKLEESLLVHLIFLENCVRQFHRTHNTVTIEELQDLQKFVRERPW
jgi:hypothetical protein